MWLPLVFGIVVLVLIISIVVMQESVLEIDKKENLAALEQRPKVFLQNDKENSENNQIVPYGSNFRLPESEWPINFGGAYWRQKRPPSARIRDILWMYNDHLMVGSRDVMMSLDDFFHMYDRDVLKVIERNKVMNPIATEAQILLFCMTANIPVVMYLDNSWKLQRT